MKSKNKNKSDKTNDDAIRGNKNEFKPQLK